MSHWGHIHILQKKSHVRNLFFCWNFCHKNHNLSHFWHHIFWDIWILASLDKIVSGAPSLGLSNPHIRLRLYLPHWWRCFFLSLQVSIRKIFNFFKSENVQGVRPESRELSSYQFLQFSVFNRSQVNLLMGKHFQEFQRSGIKDLYFLKQRHFTLLEQFILEQRGNFCFLPTVNRRVTSPPDCIEAKKQLSSDNVCTFISWLQNTL